MRRWAGSVLLTHDLAGGFRWQAAASDYSTPYTRGPCHQQRRRDQEKRTEQVGIGPSESKELHQLLDRTCHWRRQPGMPCAQARPLRPLPLPLLSGPAPCCRAPRPIHISLLSVPPGRLGASAHYKSQWWIRGPHLPPASEKPGPRLPHPAHYQTATVYALPNCTLHLSCRHETMPCLPTYPPVHYPTAPYQRHPYCRHSTLAYRIP